MIEWLIETVGPLAVFGLAWLACVLACVALTAILAGFKAHRRIRVLDAERARYGIWP